uniref:Putative secreted protein n=1 Tax=Anopheles triannulatus TaxID=58253 RepID=A0A2M4B4F3_9DIPT
MRFSSFSSSCLVCVALCRLLLIAPALLDRESRLAVFTIARGGGSLRARLVATTTGRTSLFPTDDVHYCGRDHDGA